MNKTNQPIQRAPHGGARRNAGNKSQYLNGSKKIHISIPVDGEAEIKQHIKIVKLKYKIKK
jgi:hypothetical protein